MPLTTPDLKAQRNAAITFAKDHWHDRNSFLPTIAECSFPREGGNLKSIAVFFHALGIGGGERVTRSLIQTWIDMGYRVTLLTDVPASDTEFVTKLPEEVEHVVLPDSETLEASCYPKRCDALLDVLVRRQVDTLVLCHWFFRTLPFDMYLAHSLDIPVFVYVQSSFTLFFLDSNLASDFVDTPLALRSADGIICLNEMECEFWSNFNSNVFLTQNPITELPTDKPASLNGHTVIWPARLHSDKAPERIIPIMAELVKLVPDASIKLVGPTDSQIEAGFLKLVNKYHLEKHVEICGPVPESEMPNYYRMADAYLMTSQREGWSLAMAEALALGVPCVIYELPYLTLAKCPAVVSVPQNDAHSAAKELARLLNDKPYARRQASLGRTFIRQLAKYDYTAFWKMLFDGNADPYNPTKSLKPLNQLMWSELFRAYKTNIEYRQNLALERLDYYKKELEHSRQLSNELEMAYERLGCVLSSFSYRIGRAITKLPRMLRSVIRN